MNAEALYLHNGYACYKQRSGLGFNIFWVLHNGGWTAHAEKEWPEGEDPFTLIVPLYKTRSFKFPQSSDFREAEACLIRTAVAEYIDGMVHDLKSKEASDINNRGKEAQIEYLLGARLDKGKWHEEYRHQGIDQPGHQLAPGPQWLF